MTGAPWQAVRRVRVDGRLTVVGDLHGKLGALEAVLAERDVEAGLAAGTHTLVSVGDLVDRGPRERRLDRDVHVGVEALVDRVAALARRHPDRVHVVAGNHEIMHLRDIRTRRLGPGAVSRWASQGELTLTPERLAFLTALPVALALDVAGTPAIVVHAGVPERAHALDTLVTVTDVVAAHEASRPLRELLWTNPSWSRGSSGLGFAYTRLHLQAFLEANGARVLVRGHSNEPELRELPGGLLYACVHTAQGPEDRDDPRDGYVYLAWDAPAGPQLVRRKP